MDMTFINNINLYFYIRFNYKINVCLSFPYVRYNTIPLLTVVYYLNELSRVNRSQLTPHLKSTSFLHFKHVKGVDNYLPNIKLVCFLVAIHVHVYMHVYQ